MKKKLCHKIATMGFIGYLPAPGTWATIASMMIIICMTMYIPYALFFALSLCISLGTLFILFKDISYETDPQEIVIDEYIGSVITFLACSMTGFNIFLGFFLFRFFDIIKPFGIKNIQKLPGMWGIVADDIVAGIYACCLLYCISHYASRL